MKINFDSNIKAVKERRPMELKPGDVVTVYPERESAELAAYNDIMGEDGLKEEIENRTAEFYSLEEYEPMEICGRKYGFAGYRKEISALAYRGRIFIYEIVE